jgi:hypothetical protein
MGFKIPCILRKKNTIISLESKINEIIE